MTSIVCDRWLGKTFGSLETPRKRLGAADQRLLVGLSLCQRPSAKTACIRSAVKV